MRSIALQGCYALLLIGGCTSATQTQCQKYCQYLFTTCNSGPVTQTEATCAATCTQASPQVNGGSCEDVLTYFSCVLDEPCSQLQGPAGADALQGCELEASCPLTTPSNNGSGSGSSSGNSSGNNSSSGGNTSGSQSSSSSSGLISSSSSSGSSHASNSSSGSNGVISSSSSSGSHSTSNTGSSSSSSGSSSSGSVPTVGMTCTPPAAEGDPDPCAADSAGLACNLNSDQVTYSCSLPEEFETCEPSVGCGTEPPSMTCQDNSAFGGYLCVNSCTTGSQCPDELTSCFNVGGSNICYYAFCGPTPDSIDGGVNGTGYYAPCDNAATNDGVCLPFTEPSMTLGICQASGTLAAGATGCAAYRTGSSSNLCDSTSTCIEDPSNGATVCSSICGGTVTASGGGPSCTSPDTCNLANSAPYGFCLESCTAGTTVCPTGETCNAAYAVCLP